MENRYQIVKGDCIEEMKKIPDGSIDLILTDPPYGTTSCKWDSVIPFEPMWQQIWRVLKPRGACVLFGAEPFSSKLRLSQIDRFKYDWVWHKTRSVGFVNAKLKPMNDHEIVSVFSVGKTSNGNENNMAYNPQELEDCERVLNGHKRSRHGDNDYWRPSEKEKIFQEKTNYPKTVLSFSSLTSAVHPTQKPIDLLQYLIRTYTDVGETVLDFTMGSGSTGVAAMFSNRKFIGIELDDKYFDISRRRIERAANPDYLKSRLKGLNSK